MGYSIGELVKAPDGTEREVTDVKNIRGIAYYQVDGWWYREEEIHPVGEVVGD